MTEKTHTTESSTQTRAFQAEVQEVLHLMIHSLYSNKEIFLRELVSNASDACDKLRFSALKDDSLLGGDSELRIEIEADREARTLTIRDNGIGMNREEVAENIGTIARSGTRRFLEQAAGEDKLDSRLIGQFGVGFYSSFIVADQVTLLTRRAGDPEEAGVRWTSAGTGEFTIGPEPRPHQGTEVILHLKEGEDEFLQPWTLRSLISRYSDHIGFPICLLGEPGEDETVGEWETVNQASALWTLPKAEISDEEYQSFYKHVSHDLEDAMAWTHNHVEGAQNYTSLLYLPAQAPLDLMLQRDERKGLRLYVKRVFIMDAAEQLLPHYLRFVRGVVDSDDLPLNVSRELLQENDLVRKIRSAVVRRSLDLLGRLADNEPDKYLSFWDEFGPVLKEGIVEDMANREKIAGLLRFASTHDPDAGQRTSLADYIARMPEQQEHIWFVTAENFKAARHSPHLEIFRKKGIEVLLLSDRIDEWMMGYFTEFDGHSFRSVAKGEVKLDAAETETADEAASEKNELLDRIGKVLGDEVAEVRASHRLTDSASCLVIGEHEMALHMRHLLEQAGQSLPDSRPSLEVNLEHPLLARMESADESTFDDLAHILHEQAVLAEGGQLEDPAGFVQRLNRVMLGS
jgi:molecular chaperone HtpG